VIYILYISCALCRPEYGGAITGSEKNSFEPEFYPTEHKYKHAIQITVECSIVDSYLVVQNTLKPKSLK